MINSCIRISESHEYIVQLGMAIIIMDLKKWHTQDHVHLIRDIVLQILVFFLFCFFQIQQLWMILNSVICGDRSIRVFD